MWKMANTNNINVRNNLKVILDKLASVYNESPALSRAPNVPRLVAVSKTKPKELGMISHKKSLLTIFGHKHEIKNFIKKFYIFREKNSMVSGF